MKVKLILVTIVTLFVLALIAPHPNPVSGDNPYAGLRLDLVPEANAQNPTPPIPTQLATAGTGTAYNSTSNVAVIPIASFTQPTYQRFYLYEAKCINTSSTATMAAVINSQNVSGGVTTTMAYIPCPASAGSGVTTVFNPPLRFNTNSAIVMAGSTSVAALFFYASGFVSR